VTREIFRSDILPENGKPDQVALNFVPFWVQVQNIPPGYMSEKVGTDIANYIGEFLEYDVKNNSNYLRTYMRIIVLLDVTKPLKRQKKIKRQGGEASFIKFKYERLGNFCYYCGCLGHIEDYCEKLYSLEVGDGTRLWGPEQRVDKQSNSGAGRGPGWKPEGSGATSTSSQSSVTEKGINELIPASKTVAQLLRNPQLILPQKGNNEIVKGDVNAAIIQEENNAAIITGKSKRSRGDDEYDQPISVVVSQPPNTIATNPPVLGENSSNKHNSACHE